MSNEVTSGSGLPCGPIAAVLLGLAAGSAVPFAARALAASSSRTGIQSPAIGVLLIAILLIAALGVVGLVLLLPRSTRRAGAYVLLFTGFVVVGIVLGEAAASRLAPSL